MNLATFAGAENFDVAAKAALLSDAVCNGPGFDIVIGAGVAIALGEQLRPILLANRKPGREEGYYEISALEEVAGIVNQSFGDHLPEWWQSIAVLCLDPPEPHFGPGDRVTKPNIGTVGCGVFWGSHSGFLTAGHVAPKVGSNVLSGLTSVGTVVFSSNPAGSGPTPLADVSLVELSPSMAWRSTHGSTAGASPNDTVTVLTGAPAKGVIVGFLTFFHVASIAGTYANTYLTSTCITSGGDSGAAAVDVSANVVGLVVAGTKGIASFIQDADYLVKQMSPFATVSIK